jgi:hypothetical protein
MNNNAAFIIAIFLLILGGILLMYRLLYMFCQNKPWNNPPSTLSWGWSLMPAGLAILLVVLFTPACDNKCNRDDDFVAIGVVVGGFLLAAPLFAYCFYHKLRMERPDAFARMPADGARSGLDIMFVVAGAGLLLADYSLGNCPQSC